MTKKQIVVGEVYAVKVSGQVVPVRIIRENPRGGWDGVNLVSKRLVRLETAGRARWCVTDRTLDGPDTCPVCGRRCETKKYKDGSRVYVHRAKMVNVFGKLFREIHDKCFERAVDAAPAAQ
jgi:hypothetical protein